MAQTDINDLAEANDLASNVAEGLRLLQQFMDIRNDAAGKLLGKGHRRNYLRDELIRTSVVRFSENRKDRISYYQKRFSSIATASTIKTELLSLERNGLVFLVSDPRDRRAKFVMPSKKLVAFYTDVIPPLMADAFALLTSYFDKSIGTVKSQK